MSRYIIVETAISVVINAAISAGFAFLMFGGRGEIGLWGSSGLSWDFAPQTFMIAMMSVLVPSALTRRRLRAGALQTGHRQPPPLPRHLLARALVVAILATLILGGTAIGLLALVWSAPLAFSAVLPLKIIYGALVALLVTPLALRAALSDPIMEKPL